MRVLSSASGLGSVGRRGQNLIAFDTGLTSCCRGRVGYAPARPSYFWLLDCEALRHPALTRSRATVWNHGHWYWLTA